MRYIEKLKTNNNTQKMKFKDLLQYMNDNNFNSPKSLCIELNFYYSTLSKYLLKYMEGEELHELKEEKFIKDLLSVDFVQPKFFGHVFEVNLYYYLNKERQDEFLNNCLSKIYARFMDDVKYLYKYKHSKEDVGLVYKYLKTEKYFPYVLQIFKKNIFEKLHNKEAFFDIFKPIIKEKIDYALNREFYVDCLLEDKKIYTIDKDFSVETMIKSGQSPKIEKKKLIGIEIEDSSTIHFFFGRFNREYRIDKENCHGSDIIRISSHPYSMHSYVNEDKYMIFLSGESAESFYKEGLRKIKKQVDKALECAFDF